MQGILFCIPAIFGHGQAVVPPILDLRAQMVYYFFVLGLRGCAGVEPPLRGVVERSGNSEPGVEFREWVMGLLGSSGLTVPCGARTAAEGFWTTD